MSVEEALSTVNYQPPKLYTVPPGKLPEGVCPELAALLGLVTADQYLDHCGVPRRPWSRPS